MKKFRITYSIVTEKSCEQGDFAFNGFMTRNETCPRKRNSIPKNPHAWSLREAHRICTEHDGGYEGIHADTSPLSRSYPPRWLSFSDFHGYMKDEGTTELNLHLDNVTPSSAVRIARLFKCYGT